MKLLERLMASLLKSVVTDEMRDQYERDVIGGSFDVLKVPKTSLYYQAYRIGFIHGYASQQQGDDTRKTVELTIKRVIDHRQEQEGKVVTDAVKAAGV